MALIKRFLTGFLFLVVSLFSTAHADIISTATTHHQLEINGRSIEIWSWKPETPQPNGIILFSHGAFSAPWKYENLIMHWVEAGYEVHAPLHVDSSDHPRTKEFQGMAGWGARMEDMKLLANTYGADGYIAAGHSYGALVALTLGGATTTPPEGMQTPLQDNRARLVLAFSPPGAIPGFVDANAYSEVNIPTFIQTGTKDILPNSTSYTPHLLSYEAGKADNQHYLMVIDEVDHYFGGAICRPELESPKQLVELKQASEISLTFMELYLSKNPTSALNQLQIAKMTTNNYVLENK